MAHSSGIQGGQTQGAHWKGASEKGEIRLFCFLLKVDLSNYLSDTLTDFLLFLFSQEMDDALIMFSKL